MVSRAFSALCVYSKFGHHPRPPDYCIAKFRFFRDLCCWASPWRKLRTQSLIHSSYLMSRKPKPALRNRETRLHVSQTSLRTLVLRVYLLTCLVTLYIHGYRLPSVSLMPGHTPTVKWRSIIHISSPFVVFEYCSDHGRRSVGGQGDISPYFIKWRGRRVFCPLLFRGGGRYFCTNARGILWMTGAILQILQLKCTKFNYS